ncbi:cellulose biosynthesis cyclic di-GMP-binding regulatory protein BcsB [Legionella sp. PC997]|uniref:cellulose biosynthesis cyclic di-GMP-binding regulatory protein BcsB n=1 Tax=Legionella sp. PC997 TaxID=2755562 RepID=UPI0015FD6F96|nr:cellulose biosynthesis cyclic di-GMP-binding regulatory protein BcsB [Legionella sp. PC997]QMT59660.1 cellulose biosynthesis cyclic di-GMP-binding regulatory protein BcsB [Legionella sp. PC997]
MFRRMMLLVLLGSAFLVEASPLLPAQSNPIKPSFAKPSSEIRKIFLKNAATPKNAIALKGMQPIQSVFFTLRKDKIVTGAVLKLHFTPSPSLIPIQSQLKIYLNDELAGLITITANHLGKSNYVEIPLDPRYFADRNQLKFEFIGHYQAVCEYLGSTTLWLDLSQTSFLELTLNTLQLDNDLSHFPIPFFDPLDEDPLRLPIVFANQPSLVQQRAAAILTSWFGSLSLWRGQSFSVLLNQLPQQNAIVLATNNEHPDFLKSHAPVNAPTIEMMSHPDNPAIKLLLILGRDDNDLIKAVKGIAQGNVLFHGTSVTIDKVETVNARKPYDAPNWVRTDKPVTFTELQQYKGQLQSSGFSLSPILINFNIPPDLYIPTNSGIPLELKYQYTPAPAVGNSHLTISVNDMFVKSYSLSKTGKQESQNAQLSNLFGLLHSDTKFDIPLYAVKVNNQMSFFFDYAASIGGGTMSGHCESHNIVTNNAIIRETSNIDLSHFYHYIEMPNLNVFINGGFPFSRLADLSESWILIDKNPQASEIATLLNALGLIGSRTGYPALYFNLVDDWSLVQNKDVDILIIGKIPKEVLQESELNLLIDKTRSFIKEPLRPSHSPDVPLEQSNTAVNSMTAITANNSIAGIVGAQSPYFKQRSIIALLADNSHGFDLLNYALTNKKKQSQIFGSVSVIRDSGVNSTQVGAIYTVGKLSWWLSMKLFFKNHLVFLAILTILAVLTVTLQLWDALPFFRKNKRE